MYCRDKLRQVRIELQPSEYETYALPTAPLSLSPLSCNSEVIGALYVDAAFRSDTIVWLYSVLLLVGSGFSSPVCFSVTKSATIEDRIHDLKIMRLTRCRLRHCRWLRYGASVKILEPCTLMRHCGITLLSSYFLCCFWLALVFPLQPVLLWQKSATSEDRTHNLKIMRLTRCRLRHRRRLWYGTSMKLLTPCTVMLGSRKGYVDKLSFIPLWLPQVFLVLQSVLWQNVQQVKFELATARICDSRAANCVWLFSPGCTTMKLLTPCTVMRRFRINYVAKLSFVPCFVTFGVYRSPFCTTVTKSATQEVRTHDSTIMILACCRLPSFSTSTWRYISEGIGALYADAAFPEEVCRQAILLLLLLGSVSACFPVCVRQKLTQKRFGITALKNDTYALATVPFSSLSPLWYINVSCALYADAVFPESQCCQAIFLVFLVASGDARSPVCSAVIRRATTEAWTYDYKFESQSLPTAPMSLFPLVSDFRGADA